MGPAACVGRLNAPQRKAVTRGEPLDASGYASGLLLVVAGAGTGKTDTLAYRVADLALNGVDPARILMLTFTRRAATEMRRRAHDITRKALDDTLGGLTQTIAQRLTWAGTFHSIGNRLLRHYAAHLQPDPPFSVIDRDPRRAAAIAQAYVEELERLVSELSTSAAHRERVFLEERLKVVKAELDRASTEFSRFASQNAAINIPEQGKAMVEAAAALQGHLIAAESELKGLSEIYTPNNVRVRAVEARVGELRHQLEKPGGNADAGHARDAGDEPSAYPSIRELPLLGVTYADLLRQTRIQETVYETLTQQYELAKVEEAKETPSVKVLDSASVPEIKIYPPHQNTISRRGG